MRVQFLNKPGKSGLKPGNCKIVLNMFKFGFRHRFKLILLGLVMLVLLLPYKPFQEPLSTLLEDNEGNLYSAKIAADGQWRFTPSVTLPPKFRAAITHFEDEYFFYHFGLNPVSVLRACYQNLRAGRVISGASTITMQTVRLARKNQNRSLWQKLIEVGLAFKLESQYSKREILNLYASYAPFGGNIVGLEAAAWYYYGRKPDQLSWGEICTLAVLPNAPSLIYPGKNQAKLIAKRNRLLAKLHRKGVLDRETAKLAQAEPIPTNRHPIPQNAPHLLERAIDLGYAQKRLRTTLNSQLQSQIDHQVSDYHRLLAHNEIHNLAVLVLEVETGKVLAYVGNSDCQEEGSGQYVDLVRAPRSTGSILKPFLYTFALQEGDILPQTLIADIPVHINGFAPQNFDRQYNGAVPASEILIQSLNIPAVQLLRRYGLPKFLEQLKTLDFKTINRSANHYGLSLILGGAETTLWDVCGEYMRMAQILKGQAQVKASFLPNLPKPKQELSKFYKPGALWWTMNTLTKLNRPSEEGAWQFFESGKQIAWKTGTSFGHRDAWAIGTTPKHVVGVWVGNADGEGRPGLTGVKVAAPLLFDIFKQLPHNEWFEKPEFDLREARICSRSGYLASPICPTTHLIEIPITPKTKLCPYHHYIWVNPVSQKRVNSNCWAVSKMEKKAWFSLPPAEAWYFRKKNAFYKPLPPYQENCQDQSQQTMVLVYPKNNYRIFIPKTLDGSRSKTVFEIIHQKPDSRIYWHLDRTYMGETYREHQLELQPKVGRHTMVAIDQQGKQLKWQFTVVE